MKRKLEVVSEPPDGRPLEEQPRWRNDFPIDLPRDQYVSRRDLAKFLALVSGAFATGQVWLGILSILRKREAQPPLARIAVLDDIPVGGSLTFQYPTEHDPALLVRLREDELVAYDSRCTHLSCPVRPIPEEGILHCPCHQGYFDLEHGRPFAGPPRRPLTRIELVVRDGVVYAAGVERRMQ